MFKRNKILMIGGLCLLAACSDPDAFNPPVPLQATIKKINGIIQDEFEDEQIVLYGNSAYSVMVAYKRELAGGELMNFHISATEFPNVLEDDEGNVWNIFGEAVSGPRKGEQLQEISHQVGYWFSFSAIYYKVTLYGEIPNQLVDDGFSNPEWLINPNDISQGALQDGIPSIDNPQFDQLRWNENTANKYPDNELMVVVNENNNYKAYPLPILNWHEIVNDNVNGEQVVLSYCPLTGTSALWKSNVSGNQDLEFGVSGLLYNNNLILYDRNTDSLWPQIIRQAIFGVLKNQIPQRRNSVEMNWLGLSFLQDKPAQLLNENTGNIRNYDFYPYGDYRTTKSLLFPITNTDDRLHPKERVLAVILNNKAKVYQLEDFAN